MANAIDFLPVFQEDATSIRARLDADVNAGLVPSDPRWVDTREGTFYWDVTQAIVLELSRLWDAISVEVPASTFPVFAWGQYLDYHAATFGLERKQAVSATGLVTFTGTPNTIVATGTVVTTTPGTAEESAIEFVTVASDQVDSGGTVDLPISARVAGVSGNVSAGAIDTITSPNADLTGVTNLQGTVGGTDTESDDDLRTRILLQFQGQGAGNQSDYIRWALSRDGVGRVFVNPVWNGAGTVQVVLMNSDGDPVADSVVADVQNYLDPIPGLGEGVAPIGAQVTVATPVVVTINVAGAVVFKAGYSMDGTGGTIATRPAIEAALSSYVDNLQVGEDVIYQHVVAEFFVAGVYNVTNVLVNGAKNDITIASSPPQTAQMGVYTDSGAGTVTGPVNTTGNAPYTTSKQKGIYVYPPASDAQLDEIAAMGVSWVYCSGWDTPAASTSWQVLHDKLNVRGLAMVPVLFSGTTAWTDTAWEDHVLLVSKFADLGAIVVGGGVGTLTIVPSSYTAAQRGDAAGYAQMIQRCANAQLDIGNQPKVIAWAAADYNDSAGVLSAGPQMNPDGSFTTATGGWINDMKAAVPTIESLIGGWYTANTITVRTGGAGPTILGNDVNLTYNGLVQRIHHDSPTADLWVLAATFHGAYSATFVVSDSQQVAGANKFLSDLSGFSWMKAIAYYMYQDNSAIVQDNGWGLIDSSGFKRPAWYAWAGQSVPGGTPTPTPTPATPGAPTGLSANPVATGGQVNLAWTPPSGTVTNYQYSTNGGAAWNAMPATTPFGTVLTAAITGLTNGTTYNFVVRALNSGTLGPLSNSSQVTPGVPGAPTNAHIIPGDNQVTFTADSPTPLASPITDWQFLNNTVWISLHTTTLTVQSNGQQGFRVVGDGVAAPVNGTPYTTGLRAVNAYGVGASVTMTTTPSGVGTPTPPTPPSPPPTPPTPPTAPTTGLWLNATEVAALPATGAAWTALSGDANGSWATPAIGDQDNQGDLDALAGALYYAKTGNATIRTKVRNQIFAAIGTESGPFGSTASVLRALALGRNLTSYVLAADLINLAAYSSTDDSTFRTWVNTMRTKTTGNGPTNLVDSHDTRPNNWGTHAGTAVIAAAAYLGDTATINHARDVFYGWLGNYALYHGFSYGDTAWQYNAAQPVGINPAGATATISGAVRNIDGVLPDDQRRPGSGGVPASPAYVWPPVKQNYVWEGLQGAVATAYLLERRGVTAWSYQTSAIKRAITWLYTQCAFPAAGDDMWQVPMVNKVYGTTFAWSGSGLRGKSVGYTDWSHA